jgi:trans-L-3-hydroxyproline dehydratase
VQGPGEAPNLSYTYPHIKKKGLTLDDLSQRLADWSPPPGWTRLLAVDAHTAGEPLRVVVGGFPDPGGETVLDRRRNARESLDHLRRALMWEPRGHADMYGCLVGPPTTGEGDFSVLFTHNEGFSTMCGHGIIGVVTVLVECGLAPREGEASLERRRPGAHGPRDFAIDTPAGLVRARARVTDGRVEEVAFENVPSFAARLDATVEVDGVGAVRYDLGYGGAFYAYVEAGALGLRLEPAETQRLTELGRRIKEAVQLQDPPEHPEHPDLSFMYGTIFVGAAHGAGAHSRNVCVFADGEVDRSPTGTGVAGRLALHHARGEIADGQGIEIESILGTRFRGRVLDRTTVGPYEAIVPEVAGRAWVTGRNEIFIAPDDPLAEGFLLR